MNLINDLQSIINHTEQMLNITLTDADFEYGAEEIKHVFLHETCHAAVAQAVPWIFDLDERTHTALDEIMARLLEGEIAPQLGLPAHSVEEHATELALYPMEPVSTEQYRRLLEVWQERYWPARDVRGMAEFAREYLGLG
jgi:hypothetical protein